MKLVCISDTHSRHQNAPGLPAGDVLIHAGDCTGSGSLESLRDFLEWFGSHPHSHKLLVAGNHDYCFERESVQARQLCQEHGVTYLEDDQVIIDGVVFYGSPWTPRFRDMAFNADEDIMFDIRSRIPESTQVLITHGPSWRILDYVPGTGEHAGCFPLSKRLDELQNLKAHICGHIHEGYGSAMRESDGVWFVNASSCNGRYQPVNPPIVIEI